MYGDLIFNLQKMDPVNQQVQPDISVIVPRERKRGRPRKDPSERRAQKVHMPPGFIQSNTKRVDPVYDPNEVMIGQTVTGVVEATFEAGYLLAVRLGNSNITLRGAIFKPGQTAPVTPENDVAPHAEMIKRSEIPFPTELQPKRRRKRRSKEKNMQLVTYGGPTDSVITPSSGPTMFAGPVVLQSVNLSNGLSTNQPAPHLRATQGKPVHSVLPLAVYPPNGPTSQPSESTTGSGNENVSLKQTEKSNDVPGRVVKSEPDIGDMNEQPLFVEPLQSRHTVHHFQAPTVMGAVMQGGTGRMTELLQAVQQNIGDDQGARNGHPAGGYKT